MISFKLNNEFIDLVENTSLSLEGNSPLFASDAIPGTKVYTFTARLSKKNQRLFGFAEKQGISALQSYPEVEAMLFNNLWKKGTLKLRAASQQGYSLSFHTDAGDLAGRIKGKKLADLDLGTDLIDLAGTDEIYPARKYAFFPVKNVDFYDSSQPDYAGYMNYYDGAFKNNGNTINQFNLVPFPYLLYIMNRIADQLGYHGFTGPWTEEEDIRRLVIYNNYALDRLEGTRNAYEQVIDFRHHVPDMEIGKFLVAIKNLFGLGFTVNARTKYIEVVKLRDVLNSATFMDFSQQAPADLPRTPYDGAGFRLSMAHDSNDELYKDFSDADYSYTLDAGQESFEAQAGTLFQLNEADALSGRSWSIPFTRQKGSSLAFETGVNPFSLRLLFYKGMQKDSAGALYTQGSAEGNHYKLGYSGYNGLYERCWKGWLHMLQNSTEVEATLRWSAKDLQNVDFRHKLMIRYQKYLLKDYRIALASSSRPGKSIPAEARVTLQTIRT